MKYTTTLHTVIAVASFLILSYVQFFLLYNTYELKNDHYFFAEKRTITNEYLAAIRNDKVFPGGGAILDRYVMGHMQQLEKLYNHNRPAFNRFSQQVCDSAFRDLRRANNLDSLLQVIMQRNRLNRKIQYASTIESVEIAFQRDRYIPVYQQHGSYQWIDPHIQTKAGIRVGGTLNDLKVNTLAKNIVVSISVAHTYRISFSLYIDTYDRKQTILRLMMPTFLLSLLSVGGVVLLYFVTFRNWIKQKKLSQMKSDFINSITHEFHTPLSAIIVANRTMQNEKIITNRESLLPLTEVVQRQAERLKTLIGQTLEITTMNKLSLQLQKRSVHHLLDDLLLDYRLNATESNVNLSLHKNATRDVVLLDPFWFTTIILNIFDNAVKYNARENKEIVVTTFSDRKFLHIAIADNGIGMTSEVRRHIFEKFYRGRSEAHSRVKGLGLGLFYVNKAIDSHRWKIDIRSAEGEGSVFTISIPLSD
ncbi:HAMP domain-containing histidine kinase [Niastella caeni]|uniref:histidine kinase n=1 Tax=Niastella caeni TaxID=2569763 RepID=A0A4S8HAF6_9BACT|nr:HAMP domain-containing sensor histidine kinase [Niastella caeni]THU31615.1 HAMP domain-containing histidine kinase [Niastella caeni]